MPDTIRLGSRVKMADATEAVMRSADAYTLARRAKEGCGHPVGKRARQPRSVHGSSTITRFWVWFADSECDHGQTFEGYGATPGERATRDSVTPM